MLRKLLFCSFIFLSHSIFVQAQTALAPSVQNTSTSSPSSEVETLKRKVIELEEIQNEHSEIMKKQLSDQHFDQNSRGYIELKLGLSQLNPKDIEDENDDTFGGEDDANWESFGKASILEFEIGKTIAEKDFSKHEVGIGYQQLRSRADANFEPSGGGGKINVYEKIAIHTLFARYARLFKASQDGKLYLGPGITLGYSPVSKLNIEIEQGNEGVQIYAESTSYLVEIFGKAKFEISRYFSLIATGGYRLQEAENLRLNAAELINVNTKTDLEASGLFGTIGVGVAF